MHSNEITNERPKDSTVQHSITNLCRFFPHLQMTHFWSSGIATMN